MKNFILFLSLLLLFASVNSCTQVQAKSAEWQQEYSDYIVVERTTYQWKDFQTAVDAQLRKGYKFVGGISSNRKNRYQAMAK